MAGEKNRERILDRAVFAHTKPWERDKNEPLEAYQGFVYYRDSESRSFKQTAKFVGRALSNIQRWSKRYRWTERALAWDNELDRRVRERQADDIVKMCRNHANIAVGMQQAVTLELQAWLVQINEASKEAKAKGRAAHKPLFQIRELVRLNQHATHLERLARGEPTEQVHVTSEHDISGLTTEELVWYNRIIEKLKGGGAE